MAALDHIKEIETGAGYGVVAFSVDVPAGTKFLVVQALVAPGGSAITSFSMMFDGVPLTAIIDAETPTYPDVGGDGNTVNLGVIEDPPVGEYTLQISATSTSSPLSFPWLSVIAFCLDSAFDSIRSPSFQKLADVDQLSSPQVGSATPGDLAISLLYSESFSGGDDLNSTASELIALEDGFSISPYNYGIGAAAKIATGVTTSWEWDFDYSASVFQVNFAPSSSPTLTLSGDGYSWSVGQGVFGRSFDLTGTGFNWNTGQGSFSLALELAGNGYNWSAGQGQFSLDAPVSGSGYNWSQGEGAFSLQLQLAGAGHNWSLGQGAFSVAAEVAGNGFNWNVGQGLFSVAAEVSGTGYNWNVAEGIFQVLASVAGEGFNWSRGVGQFTLADAFEGAGYNWNTGQGVFGVTLPVAGTGFNWNTGAGSFNSTLAITGDGFNWSFGAGTFGLALPLSGDGFNWNLGQGAFGLDLDFLGIGFNLSVGAGVFSATHSFSGQGFNWNVAQGAFTEALRVAGEGFNWSIGAGSFFGEITFTGAGYNWNAADGTFTAGEDDCTPEAAPTVVTDFTRFAALARRLIAKNGRRVIVQRLSATPTDVSKPWAGPSVPSIAGQIDMYAAFIPHTGSGDLGFMAIDDELLKRCEQIALFAPPCRDLTEYHQIEDFNRVWKIEWVRELRPGPLPVLYVVGVKR